LHSWLLAHFFYTRNRRRKRVCPTQLAIHTFPYSLQGVGKPYTAQSSLKQSNALHSQGYNNQGSTIKAIMIICNARRPHNRVHYTVKATAIKCTAQSRPQQSKLQESSAPHSQSYKNQVHHTVKATYSNAPQSRLQQSNDRHTCLLVGQYFLRTTPVEKSCLRPCRDQQAPERKGKPKRTGSEDSLKKEEETTTQAVKATPRIN